MTINTPSNLVVQLHNDTGIPLRNCQKALMLCSGEINTAKEYLRLRSSAVRRYKIVENELGSTQTPYSEHNYVELARRNLEKAQEELER